MNRAEGGSKKHTRYGIEVAADRYFSVNGPPMTRMPRWGVIRETDGLQVHLHPPISYEIHYRTPYWIAIFAFNSAPTRSAFGNDPLTRGRRRRGSVCLIPPETRVRVVQEQPQEFLAIAIPPDRFNSVADAAAGAGSWREGRVHSESDHALAALCGELRRVMISEPAAAEQYLGAVVDAAASRLVSSGLAIENDEIGGGLGREALAPAIRRRVAEEIDRRLGEKISVAALAEEAGLSRSHFTRAFAGSFGETPARYLLQRRIARARALLLETERPVTEIALSCGFADHAHFSTAFRKEIGLAPSAYRKTAAGRD